MKLNAGGGPDNTPPEATIKEPPQEIPRGLVLFLFYCVSRLEWVEFMV